MGQGEPELLDVRIVAFPTTLKESPVVGLRRVFGIDEVAANRLIGNLPAVVQRGVPPVRAEYFRRALEGLGAEVEVRTREGALVTRPAEPVAEAAAPTAQSAAPGPGAAPDSGATRPGVAPPADSDPPPAERRRRELFARADTAPLPSRDRTVLQGAGAAEAAPTSLQEPAAEAIAQGPANVTLREAVPAPGVPGAPAGIGSRAAPALGLDAPPPARSSAAVLELGEPPDAPLPPRAAPTPGVGAGWGALEPLDLGPGAGDAPATPADRDLAGRPALRAPPPTELPPVDLGAPSGGGLSSGHPPEVQLPQPPPAVQSRRPGARILPGEVPPSDPPQRSGPRSGAAPAPATGPANGPAAGDPTAAATPAPRGAHSPRMPAPSQPREPDARVFDTRSFWQSLGDALALPWLGHGPYWVLAIFVWSLFGTLLCALAQALGVPHLPIALGALAALSLMGFAADGFRAAFKSVTGGAPHIAQAPSFEPERIVTRYLLSALHLWLFALVTNLPGVLWYLKQTAGGASLTAVLLHPVSWMLAAFPAFYWPAALATAVQHGSFAGVWKVHVGLRAVVTAPVEYLVGATLGALTFAVICGALWLIGAVLGLPDALFVATLGLPLGLSHLLWGSLLGHMARARPEAFEP
jgi:hypothetical protein